MGETIKNHLRLDVKPPHLGLDIKRAPPFSPDTSVGSQEEEILFFQSSRQRKESTWIISFFAVVNVVTFLATMLRNDCPENSHGDCILKSLGRFSFQPLTENPLLGPSSSTLVEMGALERNSAIENHQQWRLVTCIWLHAGFIHLILNISSLLFVGIRLEQQFGSTRVGVVYLSSAFLGSLASALFVEHIAAVGSSGALFGLLGAMLSALIRHWDIYSDKVAALVVMFFVAATNIVLGLLPHVDNFSNIFGFLSGFLLGVVLFYNPLLRGLDQQKGLFDYGVKSSVGLKEKFDKPTLRCASLLIFVVILVGGVSAVLHGVDANRHCRWCHFIDCPPTRWWSCNEIATFCEAKAISGGRLSLTCEETDYFRIYPFANVSHARIRDLCRQICS